MRLVWSPEAASNAYIDTVKSCQIVEESSVAEFMSAMAAGWNSKLIVETWSRGGATATSIGLAIASRHTGGRHVCLVQDEATKSHYCESMRISNMSPEVVVGAPEAAMAGLAGVDFLVIDGRMNNYTRILRAAKLGHNGAVVICKNATVIDDRWSEGVNGGSRCVVRSVFLPVGKGLQIIHVAGERLHMGSTEGINRWFKHVDVLTGEEHVVRK